MLTQQQNHVVTSIQPGYTINRVNSGCFDHVPVVNHLHTKTITSKQGCQKCCDDRIICIDLKEKEFNDRVEQKVREQIKRYNTGLLIETKRCQAEVKECMEHCVNKLNKLTCCENEVIIPQPLKSESICCEHRSLQNSVCLENIPLPAPILKTENVCCEHKTQFILPPAPLPQEEVICHKPAICEQELVYCKKCPYETKMDMNLDEKIAKIRRELNLPGEKEQHKLIAKLDWEKRQHEKNGYFIDDRSECAHDLVERCHSKEQRSRSRSRNRSRIRTNNGGCARFRSRSKSFEERQNFSRSKSRSLSRGRNGVRPKWIPSGSNDYSRTMDKRSKLIAQQEKRKYQLDSFDACNRNAIFLKQDKELQQNRETEKLYVKATFAPIEQKETYNYNEYTNNYSRGPKDDYFVRETYAPVKQNVEQYQYRQREVYNNGGEFTVTRPTGKDNTFTRETYAPIQSNEYSYHNSRPNTSVEYKTGYEAQSSSYEPSRRAYNDNVNCYDLRPVQKTKGGAMYSCSNNGEVHYVSDKARNSIQICTSNNNYSRNADNRVRVLNSDTTVIHD